MRNMIGEYKNKLALYRGSTTFRSFAREIAMPSFDRILSQGELEDFFVAADLLELTVIHSEWAFFGGYAGSSVLRKGRVIARVNEKRRVTFLTASKTTSDLLELSLSTKGKTQ